MDISLKCRRLRVFDHNTCDGNVGKVGITHPNHQNTQCVETYDAHLMRHEGSLDYETTRKGRKFTHGVAGLIGRYVTHNKEINHLEDSNLTAPLPTVKGPPSTMTLKQMPR